MNKKSFLSLYFLCVLFALAAAVNEGFSAFIGAIPFYLLFFFLCRKHQAQISYKIWAALIIAFSIVFNLTLTKNPLIYPILVNGSISFPRDGFIMKYSDESAAFTSEQKANNNTSGMIATYTPVKAGEVIEVTGIQLTHPDLGLNRNLITPLGKIHEKDPGIVVSKQVVRPIHYLGNLMYYPALPLMLVGSIQGLFIKN